uniref:Arginine/serine-rich splicing factor 1 variant 4 n=2 Tax=Zea mays TaxID=4577 RepID=Q6IVD1_MAIZE|nr:arginine/serine-rich splicing factor 1 variant 4 [Zea mays]
MRPVFVGNLDYDTRHSELDHLFYRYGRVERIDMKSDLLLTDQDPHLPTEEHMTNQELYYDAINASGNSCRAFSGLQPAGRTYCACTGVSP